MKKKRQISLAFIGDAEVGKTAVIKMLDQNIDSKGTTFQLNTKEIAYTIWELQTSSHEPQRLGVFAESFLKESIPFDRFVIIVSDSSKNDVNKIKYSVKFLRQKFPDSRLAIIANKQDMNDRLSKRKIERLIKLPTLELSAINQAHRERLLNFLSYLIESDTGL